MSPLSVVIPYVFLLAAGDTPAESPLDAAAAPEEAARETPIENGAELPRSDVAGSSPRLDQPPPGPLPVLEDAAPTPASASASASPSRLDPGVDLDSIRFRAGKGLAFQSRDGHQALELRLRVQFQSDTAWLPSEAPDAAEEERALENTFGIRRARLQFAGHVFGKHNRYKAEFAFSPRDLGVRDGVPHQTPLLDWYAEFTHLRDLSLRLGQYKLLYSRQRVISSGDLAFVDRSLVQSEFNLDRDIGLHLYSSDLLGFDRFRYYAGVSIGEGRDVWAAQPMLSTDAGGLQYLVRVEALPLGGAKEKWDYSEVDFDRSDAPRLALGFAYAFLDDGQRVRGYQGSPFADDGRVDYHNVNADLLLKWAGVTAFGELYWREGRRQPGTSGEVSEPARNGIGYGLQLDALVPSVPVNVGARYSTAQPGTYDATSTALGTSQEAGLTIGWFPAEHALKLQADVFHLWSDELFVDAEDRVRVLMQVAY
ncbi:MAG: porin [Myxococcota bacterium]